MHVEESRHTLVGRAVQLSVLSIALSGAVGGSAVAVALATGSLSLLGFGFDAAIDSIASIALVWRFRIERREPHRAERVERVAEGVVGATLLLLAAYLVIGSLRALAAHAHPQPSLSATVLLVVSIVVLPPIALAKLRVARGLRSGALRADSILTGVAALLAGISLISLMLDQTLGVWWADAAAALLVAAIVIREGWSSFMAARRTSAT
jgi:divalent metal cation (Fe/Co/Zn/Cd) transporter